MTNQPISPEAIDSVFLEARTFSAWLPEPVSIGLLRKAYDIARMGPTSANLSPLRMLFLTTDEAKARLLPALSSTNVEKSRTAPVVALVAYDTQFYEHAERLFPQMKIRGMFEGNPDLIEQTAFRNGSLQGAYFIIAARALGLDCGPMSGFDVDKVNAEFFPDGRWKINFVLNLGYGDSSKLFPRNPRLEFEEACRVI